MWNDNFQVDPLGIAGIDGRIREGDQILQVNRHSVNQHQIYSKYPYRNKSLMQTSA